MSQVPLKGILVALGAVYSICCFIPSITFGILLMIIQLQPVAMEMYVNLFGSQIPEKIPCSASLLGTVTILVN
jgi:hypothetical protein